MAELEINETKKIIDLETAITEGNKALIPYEFPYPNTDLIVEVLLKPLTNPELNRALQLAKLNDTTVDIEMLHYSLFNTNETGFSMELLEKLPAGVVNDLSFKIAEISGIDIEKTLEKSRPVLDDLEGF